MRVLFIKPGGSTGEGYPHQIAALAGWIEQQGHTSLFYDASLRQEPPLQTAREIATFAAIDYVAISVYSDWHNWTKELVTIIQTRRPYIQTIVGGPHISALKELALEHIGANYGVIGEGELPLTMLLNGISPEAIPGLIYGTGSKYSMSSLPLLRVSPMDNLPVPAYHLIQPTTYFHTFRAASIPLKHQNVAMTVTSRGCPYKCTFCATHNTWEGKMRLYSPTHVIEEIECLINKHNVKEIWFVDDGFTANIGRAEEICERMLYVKNRPFWKLPNGVRAETINDKLVALLKKSGCYMVGIGIESGSPTVLSATKKRLDLDILIKKAQLLKHHGILSCGFFIVGLPGETEETLEETIQFVMKIPLDRIQVCAFDLLPGSETFYRTLGLPDTKKYEKNVRIYLENRSFPSRSDQLPEDILEEYYWKIVRKFYTRPSVVYSVLRHMSLKQLRAICYRLAKRSLFIAAPKRKYT